MHVVLLLQKVPKIETFMFYEQVCYAKLNNSTWYCKLVCDFLPFHTHTSGEGVFHLYSSYQKCIQTKF